MTSLDLAFHGAAGTVTGSKHLLTVGDTRILLDAGLFQGQKRLRLRNWDAPAFDPTTIDRLLLSHTHIDHVGYLPKLVQRGLRAPVHATPAAAELSELMLLDSAKIQEEDARHANRKGYSKHHPALPLYTTEDAEAALELRRPEPFNSWFSLGDAGRARFLNAGHILGAAFIELEVNTPGGPLRIVFSGDIGRFEVPLHLDPQPLPACDVLIMESTYGDRNHSHVPLLEQIRDAFTTTIQAGGTILIPAFAVGRTQLITLMLRRLMRSGELPQLPIHIDSPMAVKATGIYSRFLNPNNLDADVFEDGRLQLFPDHVRFHRTVEESKRLNDLPGPRILISSSGMLTGGRVLHHLKRLGGDKKNLIALVGYQAVGTRARALLEGARRIKIHGREHIVRCSTLAIQGLSGHADRDGLLRWFDSAPRPPRLTFLVHGEPEPAAALAATLGERATRVIVPQLDDSFDLKALLADPATPRATQSSSR